MTRTGRILVLFSAAATIAVLPTAYSATPGGSDDAANPVAQVRQARSWEYGPFLNYGNGIGDRSSYKFFWGGVQVGKPIFPVVHAGVISGQMELGANIMPLWQAYTPPPHQQSFNYTGGTCPTGQTCTYMAPENGGTFRGVSITPVVFRWNFLTSSRRFQPWIQAAGGVIYTTHKFPPDEIVQPGKPGGTCVWNFTPQGGIGFHIFTRPKRSIDVGLNAVHISSASLGDRNPGVNASLQIQVGYTFWK